MSDITVLFERSLRQSGTPLEVFLAEQSEQGVDRNDVDVVTQLACVDLTVAWETGTHDDTEKPRPRVEDYSQRLPALAAPPLKLVEAEYTARIRGGERPGHDEYLSRFPHLAHELSERLTEIDQSLPGPTDATQTAATEETVIQPAVPSEPEAFDTTDQATIVESEKSPAAPADVETLVQSTGDSATAPLRLSAGRGRVPAAGVLRTFGDYEVLSEIARGGMGVVYRARQTKLNRVVAVKMILQGQLASRDDIQRFYSEAEAAARLEHPGIVPIYEVGEVDDQHYFSMGYIDGESLSDRVKRGPLPPREAAELLRDVADAIEYAHQNGVVHRDLKPGNILLTQDGQPRVTDFGLAKTVEGDSGLTASGQILGTPGYMPPEQAAGRIHEVGPLADVYSLGAVLYCLLTGRPPFQSARIMETLKQVIETPPVSPRLLNPSVDRDLETIVLRCLEKNQTDRLHSAGELRDELQRYLNGESIHSRPVGPVTRAWRWCRRKPLAAALAASVVILAAAIFLTVHLAKSAAQTRELADARSEFQSVLDAAQPTEQWLTKAETVADRLAGLSAQHGDSRSSRNSDGGEYVPSDDARPRVFDTFATLIRRDLRRPKLDTARAEQIQAAIDLLAERVPDTADDLQTQIDRRLTDWLVDFEIAAPFTGSHGTIGVSRPNPPTAPTGPTPPNSTSHSNATTSGDSETGSDLNDIFAAETVVISSDGLQTVSTARTISREVQSGMRTGGDQKPRQYSMAPLVLTEVACRDDVQIEVTFADNWQRATEVGVALNADAKTGYDCVVKILASRGQRDGKAVELTSVEDVRQRGGSIIAEIRRNGVPLLRRKLDAAEVSAATLRLRARRVRGDLEFQINAAEPIRYYDPFSIGKRSPGVFAVRWPAEVSLTSLTAQHRPRAEAVSGLESGDALFDDADFTLAADQYRQQMAEATDNAIRQEARYKLGVCLTILKRTNEASEVLGPLMSEPEGQWPALAGIQLWLTSVRNKEHTNADAIFTLLESRYRFEELATLIPTDVRDEILDSYLGAFATVSNALQFDANRVRNIERGAAVDRLLSPDGLGSSTNQMELVRAYRYVEDWDKALAAIEPLLKRSRDTVSMRHLSRILRFAGRPEQALLELDAVLSRAVETRPPHAKEVAAYLVDRARVHVALGQAEPAEADSRRAIEIGLSDPLRNLDPHNHSQAALILGFLLEARGQKQAALDVWRDAYQRGGSLYQSAPNAYHSGLITLQALGSLTGELSDEDGSRFLKLLTSNTSGNSLVTMGTSMVTPQTITEALRDMWQTDRGRRAAREFAFESLPLRKRLALPMLLMGHAFLRSKAFGGVVTDEQDDLIWQVMTDSHRDLLELGKLKMPQLMQLGLAWKGTTNFLGWGGVAPSLEPGYRASMAWIFGHRFLRLGQHDAAKQFFATAVKDAPADSLTARLGKRDLGLLQQNHGRLVLASELPEAAVEVVRGNDVVATLTPDASSAALQPGDYSVRVSGTHSPVIRCDAAIGAKATNSTHLRIQLPLAGTATLAISRQWQADAETVPLPGLVSRPATLAGIGRWQIVRDSLQDEVRAVSWSPDGRFAAVACDDALLRIYETASWTLVRGFSGHRGIPFRSDWSPDNRYLAVMDNSAETLIWDVVAGRLHNRLPHVSENISQLSWHPESRSLAVGAFGGAGLRHVAVDGTLLEVMGANQSQSAPEWSPDGRELAVVDKNSRRFTIWNPRSASVPDIQHLLQNGTFASREPETSVFPGILHMDKPAIDVRQPETHPWTEAAWSPDGRLLATAAPGKLAVWNANGWKLLKSWDTEKSVWIAWQNDSQHLWSTGWSGDIEVRRIEASASLDANSATDSNGPVESISTAQTHGQPAIASDGQRFVRAASGRLSAYSRDGTVLADLFDGEPLLVLSLDWSPDATMLAAGIGRDVVLFDIERDPVTGQQAGRVTARVAPGEGNISSVRWAPDGSLLACCDSRGVVLLIDAKGATQHRIPLPGGPAHSLDWSPDGNSVVVAGHDGTLRSVSRAGEASEPLVDDTQPLFAVAFSPDGQRIAASGERSSLEIWRVVGATIEAEKTLPLNSKCVALEWSPDSSRIAAAGLAAEIVRISDGNATRSQRFGRILLSVDWLPDPGGNSSASQIAIVSDAGHAIVVDDDGQAGEPLRHPLGRLPAARVSPDGKTLAIGTQSGAIEFYDTQTREPAGLLLINRNADCLSLSASGQLLAESRLPQTETDDTRNGAAGVSATDSTTHSVESDLRWLVESASGEQTLLTRAEFFERLKSLQALPTGLQNVTRSAAEPTVPRTVGRLSDTSILEASGFVRSRQHNGVFWTISDSGNPNRLYALDATGQIIAGYSVTGAVNDDWETLITDASGRLFIGDVGNLGRRTQRTLYEVAEPDPHADVARYRASRDKTTTASSDVAPLIDLAVRNRITFHPSSAADDFEAAFERAGELYVLSKMQTGDAALYRLDQDASAANNSLRRSLTRVSELRGLPWITGAAVSPDKHRLALTTYTEILLFDLPPAGELPAELTPATRIPFEAPLIESVAFEDASRLLILSETGDIYHIDLP